MSAAGEAQDACASRARPRPEGRVCEHGWRPTLIPFVRLDSTRRAHRSSRRRVITRRRQLDLCSLVECAEAALSAVDGRGGGKVVNVDAEDAT